MPRLKLKRYWKSPDVTDLSFLTARPITHRGFHDLNRDCWENTLPAFERAIDAEFAIECDVQQSADGVAMVFHDVQLDRLTGVAGNIHDFSADELSKLTIGGTDSSIPTLEDMLDLIQGRVPLVIELKRNPGHDGELVAAVGRALSGYRGPAAVMSFEHRFVRAFKEHAPGVPSGLTSVGLGQEIMEANFAMLAYDISFVSYSVNHLPNRFVDFVRNRLNMPVITWTVRNQQHIEQTRMHADQITFEGFDPDSPVFSAANAV